MASIQLSNLQKRYGSVEAIKGISLDIEDGEMVVLVGPSGCGKSTLLRMVAGLESISDGVLRIGENDVSNVEPADRDIAMVFQNYALYPQNRSTKIWLTACRCANCQGTRSTRGSRKQRACST
jgi:sn-glycerol 3-phosphate transport system ATP-binding protein